MQALARARELRPTRRLISRRRSSSRRARAARHRPDSSPKAGSERSCSRPTPRKTRPPAPRDRPPDRAQSLLVVLGRHLSVGADSNHEASYRPHPRRSGNGSSSIAAASTAGSAAGSTASRFFLEGGAGASMISSNILEQVIDHEAGQIVLRDVPRRRWARVSTSRTRRYASACRRRLIDSSTTSRASTGGSTSSLRVRRWLAAI